MTTSQSTKTLMPADKIVKSLLELREELLPVQFGGLGGSEGNSDLTMILFKINSCLYSEYVRCIHYQKVTE